MDFKVKALSDIDLDKLEEKINAFLKGLTGLYNGKFNVVDMKYSTSVLTEEDIEYSVIIAYVVNI